MDRENLAAPELRVQLSAYTPEDVIPPEQWFQLLATAAALSPGKPAVGLDIGSGFQAKDMGLLAYLLAATETVRDLLAACTTYARLSNGMRSFVPHTEAHWHVMTWHDGAPVDAGAIIAQEIEIVVLVMFYRHYIGVLPPSTLISFQHRVESAEAYRAFFGLPCHLRQQLPPVQAPAQRPGYTAATPRRRLAETPGTAGSHRTGGAA